MDIANIVVIVVIVLYVIGRQLLGEPLRAKRVIILPIALTIFGIVDIAITPGKGPAPVDIILIVLSAAISLYIGIRQGMSFRLEARNGYLWGQLPLSGLWLWLALLLTRGAIDGVGYALGAHMIVSTSALLLGLGINRIGQAVAIMRRAADLRVPFAPDEDFAEAKEKISREFERVSRDFSAKAPGRAPGGGPLSEIKEKISREISDKSREISDKFGR